MLVGWLLIGGGRDMATVQTTKDMEIVGQLQADLLQGKSVDFNEIKPWKLVVLRTIQRDYRKTFNLIKSISGRIYLAPWGYKNAIQHPNDTVWLCGFDI